MNKPYLFTLTESDQKDLFDAASDRTGLPAFVVEKDYYVTLVLKILFEQFKPQHTQHTSTPIMFKGGTTLSKVYQCIERMSEDIDLSLDMGFLGYPEVEGESNRARERRIELLNEAAQTQVEGTIAPFLREVLGNIDQRFSVSVSPGSSNIEIYYPKMFDGAGHEYINPRVLLECGGKAGLEPSSTFQITPIALEEVSEHEDHCQVDALGCDRTFFEKLTAIHEFNHRGVSHLAERQSRHLYDVVKIHESHPGFIEDTDLLAKVVEHKTRYFRRGSANYDQAVPGTLWIIPEGDVASALERDWEQMDNMFPNGAPYSFSELIRYLEVISHRINGPRTGCIR